MIKKKPQNMQVSGRKIRPHAECPLPLTGTAPLAPYCARPWQLGRGLESGFLFVPLTCTAGAWIDLAVCLDGIGGKQPGPEPEENNRGPSASVPF